MTRADLERRLRAAATHEDWVEALAEYFERRGLAFGHGTDNAADEAFWLIRHLHEWRDDRWQAAPNGELVPALAALAERRVLERQPLAYLLGEAWFAGLRFAVDERVLVPRSPLAEMIERGFEPWCALAPGDRVLDVGTGSGCIAIATAKRFPFVQVEATDISAAALHVAAANAARHGCANLTLIETDLFPPGPGRYRVIVSNPPYVADRDLAALPAEYRHEPAEALAGGPTGFEIVERIVAGAAARLLPGGVLIVEVGGGQEAFAARHPEWPMIWPAFARGGDGVFVLAAEELP